MLISRKAMKEIYDVAEVIHDIRGVSPGNELMIEKDVIEKLPHGSSIIHKLAEQYEVIDLASTPYDPDNDEQIYKGLNAEEIAVRLGTDPTDPRVISHIRATTLSYGLIVEPIFEDFMTILKKGLDDGDILSDEDLTMQPEHRVAELSFEIDAVPTVTFNSQVWHYASMQYTSMAFKIIDYCLKNHPDNEVDLDTLLENMDGSAGLKNVNEAIRKSPLFSKGGSLDVFITSSPRTITVTPRVMLTEKDIPHVSEDSVENRRFWKNLHNEYSA